MIELPDFKKKFEYENGFYLTCATSRMSKIIAHYELFKMTMNIPGAIVECGVFKGTSLARFAMFRDLFGDPFSKNIIGFDTFGKFPETSYEPDKEKREQFIKVAGEQSISIDQMKQVLKHKKCDRSVELIPGNICRTVPEYVSSSGQFEISLLNLDVDIYEPSVTILNHLYPKIIKGGVLILDDYGSFEGETKAVDEYFKGMDVAIQRFPFCKTPCYIVKG